MVRGPGTSEGRVEPRGGPESGRKVGCGRRPPGDEDAESPGTRTGGGDPVARGRAQTHHGLGALVPTHAPRAMLRPARRSPRAQGPLSRDLCPSLVQRTVAEHLPRARRRAGATGATKARRPQSPFFHAGPRPTTILNVTGKPRCSHIDGACPRPSPEAIQTPRTPRRPRAPAAGLAVRASPRARATRGAHLHEATSSESPPGTDAGSRACENGVSPLLTTHSVKTMSSLIGAETCDVASNVQKTSLNPQMPPQDGLCRAGRQRSAK